MEKSQREWGEIREKSQHALKICHGKITALKGKVKSLSEGPEQNKFVWIASDFG